MKTKNKLLTDEQLEMIEIAVEYLFQRQSVKDKRYRLGLSTALDRIYVHKKAMKKWPSGHIGVAAFKFLIGKNPQYPMKFDDVIEYSNKKYISLYEAKKKIEAHYMRQKVWDPAQTMAPANGQTPLIYAIVDGDKIERINMCEFVDLPASMPELVWNFVCKMHKIKFWAYPKDILPSDDERGTTGTAL